MVQRRRHSVTGDIDHYYNFNYHIRAPCPDGSPPMGGPCPTLLMDRGILMENRIIGSPRLRQLKVHNSSCHIVSQFSGIIRKCFARYDSDKVRFKIYLRGKTRELSLVNSRKTGTPSCLRDRNTAHWTPGLTRLPRSWGPPLSRNDLPGLSSSQYLIPVTLQSLGAGWLLLW